jgi:membrane protease YdiL (CAAX protease family)
MSAKKTVFVLFILLITLQLTRFVTEQIAFLFVERNDFTGAVVSSAAMYMLTVTVLIATQTTRQPLSVLPGKFNKFYIISTMIYIALVDASILVSEDLSFETAAAAVYACAVTPVFEEILFRGFVWNKLSGAFKNQWITYIITTLLFALWHLGYIDTVALKAHGNIAVIMLWKAITGLCFGVVLGFARIKAKNCYFTILLHGIMNVFGR